MILHKNFLLCTIVFIFSLQKINMVYNRIKSRQFQELYKSDRNTSEGKEDQMTESP